jgi:hypothetical protein
MLLSMVMAFISVTLLIGWQDSVPLRRGFFICPNCYVKLTNLA